MDWGCVVSTVVVTEGLVGTDHGWLPGDYAMWRFGGRPRVHIVMGVGPRELRTACHRPFEVSSVRPADEDEANRRPCAACWESL